MLPGQRALIGFGRPTHPSRELCFQERCLKEQGFRSNDAPQSGRTIMKVGIPREIKNNEYRVAITPAGVLELVRGGHQVVIEAGAGESSVLPDDEFTTAGGMS